MEFVLIWLEHTWLRASVKEKVLFFVAAGLFILLSVFVPLQSCQVSGLRSELKATQTHLAKTMLANQILKSKKRVGELTGKQHHIALELYKTIQASKELNQSKDKLVAQIQDKLRQFGLLQKKIKAIERDGKKEVDRLGKLDIDEQIKEIQRRSKQWQQ